MCFSASASFIASGVLFPVSFYSIYNVFKYRINSKHDIGYFMFALIPFFFAIQQLTEGFIWMSIHSNNIAAMRIFTLIFIFFSHFFWPIWIPLTCYMFTQNKRSIRGVVLLFFLIVGVIISFISVLYFFYLGGVLRENMAASFPNYNINFIWGEILGTQAPKYIYILIIILPLLFSRKYKIKVFGVLVFLTVIATFAFYSYAFDSVWCFFAAIISIYILFLVSKKKKAYKAMFKVNPAKKPD